METTKDYGIDGCKHIKLPGRAWQSHSRCEVSAVCCKALKDAM